MKKYIVVGMLLFFMPCLVFASSGSVKTSTVIKCDGILYGAHGNPKHYHVVEEKNGKYYAVGEIVERPSCVLEQETKEVVTLVSCVDGDTATFKTKDGSYKTRFLAVDTPETKHPTKGVQPFGKEASDYTCNALKKAEKIELEYDDNSDKYDKYDRLLAWVFVDGRLLQQELIQKGLGEVAYLYDDYKYTPLLEEAQKKAKEEKVGKWQEESKKVSSASWLDRAIQSIQGFFAKIVNNITGFLENVI